MYDIVYFQTETGTVVSKLAENHSLEVKDEKHIGLLVSPGKRDNKSLALQSAMKTDDGSNTAIF